MVRNHGHGHINHLISYHIVSCHITVIVISLKTLACIERCVYEKEQKLKKKTLTGRVGHVRGKRERYRGSVERVACACVSSVRVCKFPMLRNDKERREIEREA